MNLKTEFERVSKGLRAAGLYRRCVRPGHLCFDIGANNGSRAIIFMLLGAKTIAVEPNEVLTRKLKRFPRIHVVNKAVSNLPGTQKMLFNANDQISSLNPDWRDKWPEFPEWRESVVECVTLDQLIAQFGCPDFCKIDVEGFEPTVLAGLTRPLPFLSFETAPDFQKNTETCLTTLEKLGAYEFNFAVGDDFRWLAEQWVDAAGLIPLVKTGAGDVYARLKK